MNPNNPYIYINVKKVRPLHQGYQMKFECSLQSLTVIDFFDFGIIILHMIK